MKNSYIRYYFTLADLFNVENATAFSVMEDDLDWSDLFPTHQDWEAYAFALLASYVWPNNYADYVGYVDVGCAPWEDPTEPEFVGSEAYNILVGKMYSWMNSTAPKYAKLIKLYKDEENNLLKAIESKVKFNNTPQTTTTGLDGDEYTSTYTVSSTDANTLMARLNEIRDSYDNLYRDWADEFSTKFIIHL